MDVQLKGLSEDGSHLLLSAPDGSEARLPVTDELRALMRHARVVRSQTERASTTMSPREIQQRIRAGLNAAELAHLTGEPVEALAKFEAPVLAERAYIVELARGARAGRQAGTPSLGELVDDRLVARGADPAQATWDAWRELDEPWHVAVEFTAGGRTARAVWTFDHVAKAVRAQDEESVWLTETELLDAPIPKRHLAAVRPEAPTAVPVAESRVAPVSPADADDAQVEADVPLDSTDALLAELAARRGVREPIAAPDEDDDDAADDADEAFVGFGPAAKARAMQASPAQRQGVNEPKAAGQDHPAGPAPSDKVAQSDAQSRPVSSGERRSRRGRASVPSWDDIVFGSKGD